MNQSSRLSLILAMFWATAIIAAAILRAPGFLTLILLPVLGISSLSAVGTLLRPVQGVA
jgi:hypothetical protein